MTPNIALKLPARHERRHNTGKPSAGLLWATTLTAILLAGLVSLIGQ
ncbi:hypothetical protein [Sedimenticola thiotaurini]|nr:hypothetical protein [Sedimenticola thiotaurini]